MESSGTVLRHWPSALGLATAALALAADPDGPGIAVAVFVAALCYLGAAALGRRWVAWAGVPAGALVAVLTEAAGLPNPTRLVIAAAIALALVVAGVLGGVPRPALAAQTAALVGYGGLAAVASLAAPRVALALAGVVLACHAVWDVVHHRRDQVVPRSLAEYCIVLDVPLGVGAVVLAIIG
ncbi:hypothetical protein [Actinomadura kijaniata]|uniref:hypothetical protein n=1 Tax=Actinomadura kijaniata TaxID=46161 RepID=UPI0008374E20|nr:hypothetical protein [Actinomadura kijaniata]